MVLTIRLKPDETIMVLWCPVSNISHHIRMYCDMICVMICLYYASWFVPLDSISYSMKEIPTSTPHSMIIPPQIRHESTTQHHLQDIRHVRNIYIYYIYIAMYMYIYTHTHTHHTSLLYHSISMSEHIYCSWFNITFMSLIPFSCDLDITWAVTAKPLLVDD